MKYDAEETFYALKDNLEIPRILVILYLNSSITGEIDKCVRKLGTVLLQTKQKGIDRRVGLLSRFVATYVRKDLIKSDSSLHRLGEIAFPTLHGAPTHYNS